MKLLTLLLSSVCFLASCQDVREAPAPERAPPAFPAEVLSRLGAGIEDVELIRDDGKVVRWEELNGAPRAVFFGFTACPVICPTTIQDLQQAQEILGKPANSLRVYFVSVDPARDKAGVLGDYVRSFGDNIQGLTGSEEAIKKVADSFRASYRKTPDEQGGYTLEHTAVTYFLDASGAVRDVAPYGENPAQLAGRMKVLLAR